MTKHVISQVSTRALFFAISLLAFITTFGVLSTQKAEAAADYNAAYSRMSSRLPSTDYDLQLKGSPLNQTTQVSTDCGAAHACNAVGERYRGPGSVNHQYLTLGETSINDTKRTNGSFPFARKMEFIIYTKTPSDNKDVRIYLINRAIDDNLACNNEISAAYFSANGNTRVESRIISSTAGGKTTGCNRFYDFNQFPSRLFTEKVVDGKRTGIFTGKIVLYYPPAPANNPNTQSSFQLSTSINAKLGHMGTDGNRSLNPDLSSRYQGQFGWTNVYPTNYADDHKINFYFRPNCNINNGDPLPVTWDDIDYPNSNFQPNRPTLKIFRYNPENPPSDSNNPGELVREFTRFDNPSDTMTFGAQLIAPGKPYAYMARFEGIYGGNGISFLNYFDSGDAFIPCPGDDDIPPAAQSACTFSRFRDAGSYDPPGGLNVAYSTNTFVDITDSSGNRFVNSTLPTAQANSGRLGSGVEREWNYVPLGRYVTVKVERQYNNTSLTPARWVTYDEPPPTTYDCRPVTVLEPDGSCSIQVYGDSVAGRPTGFRGGTQITVVATMRNTGPINNPENLSGRRLALNDGAGNIYYLNRGLNVGEERSISFERTAPDSVGTHSISLYPDYFNGTASGFPLGPACSVTYETFKPFSFSLNATVDQDNPEDPNRITYRTSVTENMPDPPGSITATTTRGLLKRPAGNPAAATTLDGLFTDTRQFDTFDFGGDREYFPAREPRQLGAGDRACAYIDISVDSGWVGPGGVVAEAVNGPAVESCQITADRPYATFYGGDISVGGGFGTDGACTSGSIRTYSRPLSDFSASPIARSGSGAQFAVMAYQSISGFSSALTRTSLPIAPLGLTFANNNNSGGNDAGNSNRPNLGGNFGACATAADYYNSTRYDDESPNVIKTEATDASASIGNGKQTKFELSGSRLNLSGAALPDGSRNALYVDGDVYITSDIIYQNTSWGAINQIPNFALIVKGNIFIDPNVGRLDGLYVAQKRDDGSRGTIFTCAPGANDISGNAAELYNQCRSRQLVFNGSVIAKQMKLLRVNNTLDDSRIRERPGNSRAGEVFNFSPEAYISEPLFRPRGTVTSGEYDYITTLPPIL